MAARNLRFIVLAEDHTHQHFVRSWLKSAGVEPRDIFLRKVAADATGDGGEKYVRQQYATEVQYYRSKANHQRIALIVVVDADTGTVARRHQQLEDALDQGGVPPRETGERIAILVPRRNIETWLQALVGTTVDEVTDHKRAVQRDAMEACIAAGDGFAAFLRRPPMTTDLPSLTAARTEDARLA